MVKFETENPKLTLIIGACVAVVMFVGSTLVASPAASETLLAAATFLCGVIGIQVKQK